MARHVEGRGNETPRDLGRNAFVRVVRCALLRPLDVPGLALLAFRERVARARALRLRRRCLSDGGVPLPLHRVFLRGGLALRLSVLRHCRREPRALAGVVEQRRDTRHCSCTARAVSALAARARQPQEGSHATCSLFRFGTILAADAIEIIIQGVLGRLGCDLTGTRHPKKSCCGGVECVRSATPKRLSENISMISRADGEDFLDPSAESWSGNHIHGKACEQPHFCVQNCTGLLAKPVLRKLQHGRLCSVKVVTRKRLASRSFNARGAHTTTITSSELLSRSVCAVARGGGSALESATRAPSSDVD